MPTLNELAVAVVVAGGLSGFLCAKTDAVGNSVCAKQLKSELESLKVRNNAFAAENFFGGGFDSGGFEVNNFAPFEISNCAFSESAKGLNAQIKNQMLSFSISKFDIVGADASSVSSLDSTAPLKIACATTDALCRGFFQKTNDK